MKRSYIRSFVFLLCALGDDLKWPKAVARNLGVDVARSLKSVEGAGMLREQLAACGSADEQNDVLRKFAEQKPANETPKKAPAPKEKREFFVGDMKVTARKGECRIVAEDDFAGMTKAQLERAVEAFRKALREGNPRVTSL